MGNKASLDFSGQKVFVGLDVHLKSWRVAIELENTSQAPFHQEPDAQKLYKHLTKNHPNAEYHCVYEAGFSGYWLKDKLEDLGVHCMVAHPADVPTSDKEKRQKSDKLDIIKLAKSLKRGDLVGIHVPDREGRDDRGIVRNTERISRDRRRTRNRIKSHFHFNGMELPDGDRPQQYWSSSYTNRLRSISDERKDVTLRMLVDQYLLLKQLESEAVGEIRKLATAERYLQKVTLLRSIPGIGMLTSMLILTEVGDIGRFRQLDQLCAYVGLIPDTRSSGEKNWVGAMTCRGNRLLKTALIESSWMAIRKDPALALAYETWKRQKGNGQKVIVKIARKLLSRIRFVLTNNEPYRLGVTE